MTDGEALAAFQTLARLEGILPALESAHAVAYAQRIARELGPSAILLVNLSGRGDKDVQTVEKAIADGGGAFQDRLGDPETVAALHDEAGDLL